MSEIKTKIRTYNDVIDLFGEEFAETRCRPRYVSGVRD